MLLSAFEYIGAGGREEIITLIIGFYRPFGNSVGLSYTVAKERRACDALNQRLVSVAAMFDSVFCKVYSLRTGGKGKSVLLPDVGQLLCEAVKLF